MTDKPMLPVGVWDDPHPDDLKIHDVFTQAWFVGDDEVRQFYQKQFEEEDDNVTLRAMAYQCNTRGTNTKVGYTINQQIVDWRDDGSWCTTRHSYWFGHPDCPDDLLEGSNIGYTRNHVVFGANWSMALNGPVDMPPSLSILGQNTNDEFSSYLKFDCVPLPPNVIINYACILLFQPEPEDYCCGIPELGDFCEAEMWQTISGSLNCFNPGDCLHCAPADDLDEYDDYCDFMEHYGCWQWNRTFNRVDWTGKVNCIETNPGVAESPNIACVVQEIADLRDPQDQSVDIVLLIENNEGYIADDGWGLEAADAGLWHDGINGNPSTPGYCSETGLGAILQIWYTTDTIPSGGVVVNGSADYGIYTTSGGVKVNGTARMSSIDRMTGGVKVGGGGDFRTHVHYTASGSIYIDNWDIELWLPFEIASDSTANDISGKERHAIMRNMYSWQYVTGRIGTKSLSFADIVPYYTVVPSGGVKTNGTARTFWHVETMSGGIKSNGSAVVTFTDL